MGLVRYLMITAAAAACAGAVVLGGAFFVLPVLCPNGYSPDKCMAEESTVVEVADAPVSVPGIDGDLETGLVVAPAPQKKADLTTRRVQVLPVSARGNGFPPVIGAMMVPSGDARSKVGVVDLDTVVSEDEDIQNRPEIEVVAPADRVDEQVPETEAVVEDVEPVLVAEPSDDRRMVSSDANVRSGPTLGAEVLFALSSGAPVVVTDEDKGWLSIEDEQGRPGWIYSDYVDAP